MLHFTVSKVLADGQLDYRALLEVGLPTPSRLADRGYRGRTVHTASSETDGTHGACGGNAHIVDVGIIIGIKSVLSALTSLPTPPLLLPFLPPRLSPSFPTLRFLRQFVLKLLAVLGESLSVVTSVSLPVSVSVSLSGRLPPRWAARLEAASFPTARFLRPSVLKLSSVSRRLAILGASRLTVLTPSSSSELSSSGRGERLIARFAARLSTFLSSLESDLSRPQAKSRAGPSMSRFHPSRWRSRLLC